MYYLVKKGATTLTIYSEAQTTTVPYNELFNLSPTAFGETVAPYSVGDHIEQALAFRQTLPADEQGDINIVTKPEFIELVITGQKEATAIIHDREDSLAMTLGLIVAGPFFYLLIMLVLKSFGTPAFVADIIAFVLTVGFIIAWFILVWSRWSPEFEDKFEKLVNKCFKRQA
ncbi:hypothetical protein ACAW68_06210 [Weissella confusa]|uniref:hypothetical protein n=1 Tax=Weissella confusa TaxID=1583 RepID=UPI0035A31EEF